MGPVKVRASQDEETPAKETFNRQANAKDLTLDDSAEIKPTVGEHRDSEDSDDFSADTDDDGQNRETRPVKEQPRIDKTR